MRAAAPGDDNKSFYMGIYEVTQAQWAAVMGTNQSGFADKPNNPVENTSWEDCQEFIAKLNKMGLGTFSLPTEAKWEHACKAGSSTRYYWGNDANYSLIGQYAWYSGNSNDMTHPVGQKKPNAWGLYDMHGNVYEWCSDWFGNYANAAQTDPKGPSSGSNRVERGGSWSEYPQFCRSADRFRNSPTNAWDNLGFRLVRTP